MGATDRTNDLRSVFAPTKESLNGHPLPGWFDDGKFGIMLHFGLYSVPGFAPLGDFAETLKSDYRRALLVHPFAEDYWNAIKDPSTPSAAFHRENYRGMPYQGFRHLFSEGLTQWDPAAWARTFSEAGARYVVLTAKYHDGYCLWPTRVPNPHQQDWSSTRDVVGELAEEVRARGMRFGLYYSGGVDWTFKGKVIRTMGDYIAAMPGRGYAAYADAHVRELITRYRPDILWNDIAWPSDRPSLFRLFADYYNAVPDGVVNDRWLHRNMLTRLITTRAGKPVLDAVLERAIRHHPDPMAMFTPTDVAHCDFRTPEYTSYAEIQTKRWELDRGVGNSFGYNRQEGDDDYASTEDLLTSLVDAVSKNGSLLLNLGPRGEDAALPDLQVRRLQEMGSWLHLNGPAVFGTRPWTTSETTTDDDLPVRFTRHEDSVNIVILGDPSGPEVFLRDVTIRGSGRLLDSGSHVEVSPESGGTRLRFVQPLGGQFGPTVVVAA